MLHDLARMLVLRGHEVTVVCSRRSYDGTQRYPAAQDLDGVHVRRVPSLAFGRHYFSGKLANYASFSAAALLRLAQLPRADVIVSLTTPPYLGVVGSWAAWLKHSHTAHWIMDLYPDVMAAHGTLRREGLVFRLLGAMTKHMLRRASLTLTLGPHMHRCVSRYIGPANIQSSSDVEPLSRWVPLWGSHGLAPWPTVQPNPVRDANSWRDGELVLLYSGNMGLGHRFAEFLAAAEALGPGGPPWVFAGDGPRKAEIAAFARAHPSARVSLLPYAPSEQLRETLCAADVHLASQRTAWQGLIVPSKIQSSFCVGKPVIFVGGNENEAADWIRESGGGWVVSEGDVPGLLRAVEEAREPAERRRRGLAAWTFAQERFSCARNCSEIAALLERAAKPT